MSIVLARGFDAREIEVADGTPLAPVTGRKGTGYGTSIDTASGVARWDFPGGAVSGEIFVTVWFNPANPPSSSVTAILTLGGPGGAHMNIAMNSSRQLILRTATTVRVTGAAVAEDVWVRIDMKVIPNNSGGTCTFYVNGVEWATYTGDTTASASDYTSSYITLHGFTSGSFWYDDLVVCDTSGAVNTSFIGSDVQVLGLMPSGAGDSAEWSSPTGDPNWQNMDGISVAAPDGATDYNYSLAAGDLDRYAMENLPSHYTDIKAVLVTAIARRTGGTARSLKASLKSSSSTVEGSSGSISNTTAPSTHSTAVLQNDPATSAPWTNSGVNAILGGAETV